MSYDFNQLIKLGIQYDDAVVLRRIAVTLHRWYELECGDGNNYASWTITRGYKINGAFVYDEENGDSYEERHVHSENKARYTKIPDRERGAKKRLAKVMAKYPHLLEYLQTDPRGAPLYICEKKEILNGDINQKYIRGVAVHK